MNEYINKLNNVMNVSCGQLKEFQSRFNEFEIHHQQDNEILVGKVGQCKTMELNYDKEMLYYIEEC